MRVHHVVVIGASAGGIETLRILMAALPPDLAAPVCVVMHTAPQSPGVLADILGRAGSLTVLTASTGARLKPGTVYVAPPDYHLLVEPGTLRLTKGPRENRFRPAIDPLFRSAAQVYGPATIGVILSGNLDDGSAGLWTIKQLGGVAVAQDPDDALYPGMPRHAIEHVNVDHVLPASEIGPLLTRLTETPVTVEPAAAPEPVEIEVKIANEYNALDAGLQKIAEPSSFACPECHGVLLRMKEGKRIRFRCHTGHAFSVPSLVAAVTEGIEEAMWSAIRALEEGGMLMQQMAEHLEQRQVGAGTNQLIERADQARRQSDEIRRLVTEREAIPVVGRNT